MKRGKANDHVLGARDLTQFDFCIIGSGAGGSTAAHILTAAGKTVLILEAGPNAYPALDDPKKLPLPLHSNDELKYSVRGFISPQGDLEPRTFRQSAGAASTVLGDVNTLPKAVGGAFQHADCKTPRFNAVDFHLKSTMEALIAATPGLSVPGFGADAGSANFADWPFTYDDLEPFYNEVEQLYSVQGDATDNPFASPRSQPYPTPPGVPMYFALRLADGARATSFLGGPLHPHTYPAAIAARFAADGRPPCVDCGRCSGFACANSSKRAPTVTPLRRALLSRKCQLIYQAQVVRLLSSGRTVTGVHHID